jgi:hypothetical protein
MSSFAYCSTFVARVRRKEHMRFHGVPGGTAVSGQRARCGGERVSGFDLPKSSQRPGTSAILVAGARARQAGCIAGMTRSASIEMPRASRSAKRAPESINRQRADALWRCMKPALRPAGGGGGSRRQKVDESRLRAAKIFYQGVWAAIAIGRQRQ